jgi:rhodanese-related sulfurtransferase
MNLIGRDELKAKLDRGDDFKLVCALSEWAYQAKHIPGSLHVDNLKQVSEVLDPTDEVVVYCSDPNCPASKFAYMQLTRNGYENVRRYEGGILDWEEAGLPLEGEWSDAETEAEAIK